MPRSLKHKYTIRVEIIDNDSNETIDDDVIGEFDTQKEAEDFVSDLPYRCSKSEDYDEFGMAHACRL